MRRILSHRPSPALALSTVALVAALGGVAWAAIPGPSGIIHGCYNKHGGQLRVINLATGGRCRHKEAALSWSETGPPGPRGGGGPKGATGKTGKTGVTGAQGPSNAYAASETGAVALTPGGKDVLNLALPAGKYVVTASVNIANADTPVGETEKATCVINSVPTTSSEASGTATVPFVKGLGASETVPLDGAFTLAAPATLEMFCTTVSSGAMSVSLAQIDAIQVAHINGS
jgi:hypothetical protein